MVFSFKNNLPSLFYDFKAKTHFQKDNFFCIIKFLITDSFFYSANMTNPLKCLNCPYKWIRKALLRTCSHLSFYKQTVLWCKNCLLPFSLRRRVCNRIAIILLGSMGKWVFCNILFRQTIFDGQNTFPLLLKLINLVKVKKWN